MASAVALPIDPLWLQNGNYTADEDRVLIAGLGLGEGVADHPHFKVTQRAAGSNMSVDVAPGTAYIAGDTGSGTRGYIQASDAVVNVPIDAPPGSNSRIDLICIHIEDAAVGGGVNNRGTLLPVTGTSAASPTAPAVPANAIKLAEITVPSGTTTVVNSRIADKRSPMHRISTAPAASRLPVAPDGFITTDPTSGEVAIARNGSGQWVNIDAASERVAVVEGSMFGGTPPDPSDTVLRKVIGRQTVAFLGGGGTITLPFTFGGILHASYSAYANSTRISITHRTTGTAISGNKVPIYAEDENGPRNGATLDITYEVTGWL